MASLRSFVQKSTVSAAETNLERGKVWAFTLGHVVGTYLYPGNFCWIAPANGTVTVEVWGAAGSGSRMCCCGYGLPGNPGAYAKKTYSVVTNCYICGCLGVSCGSGSGLCFRGCSTATTVCIACASTTAQICAQGGMAGFSLCNNGAAGMFCCFVACGFCNTQLGGTGCGIICNYSASASLTTIPTASGGDINCSGTISCVYFGHCNPVCLCNHINYVKISSGIYGEGPATAAFSIDFNGTGTASSGVALPAMSTAINSLGKTPNVLPYPYCWTGLQSCACYEAWACIPYFGTGVPGGPVNPVASVRDNGMRGGNGMVRIQFIAT